MGCCQQRDIKKASHRRSHQTHHSLKPVAAAEAEKEASAVEPVADNSAEPVVALAAEPAAVELAAEIEQEPVVLVGYLGCQASSFQIF